MLALSCYVPVAALHVDVLFWNECLMQGSCVVLLSVSVLILTWVACNCNVFLH